MCGPAAHLVQSVGPRTSSLRTPDMLYESGAAFRYGLTLLLILGCS